MRIDSIVSFAAPPTLFETVLVVTADEKELVTPNVIASVFVKLIAPFALGPFVDRYSTSIRDPAPGAIPNVLPSPNDNSK